MYNTLIKAMRYASEKQRIFFQDKANDELNKMNQLVIEFNEHLEQYPIHTFETHTGDYFLKAIQSGTVELNDIISYFKETDSESKIGIKEDDYKHDPIMLQHVKEAIKEDQRLEDNADTHDLQWYKFSNLGNVRLAPWEYSTEKYSEFDPMYRTDRNPIFRPKTYPVTIDTTVPVYYNKRILHNGETIHIPNIRIIMNADYDKEPGASMPGYKIPKDFDINFNVKQEMETIVIKTTHISCKEFGLDCECNDCGNKFTSNPGTSQGYIKCSNINCESFNVYSIAPVVLKFLFIEYNNGNKTESIKHVKVKRRIINDMPEIVNSCNLVYYRALAEDKMRKYINKQKYHHNVTKKHIDKDGNIQETIYKIRHHVHYSFVFVSVATENNCEVKTGMTKEVTFVKNGGFPFAKGPINPETNRYHFMVKQLGSPINALYECNTCKHKFRAIDATVCVSCGSEYITYNRYDCQDCGKRYFDHNYSYPIQDEDGVYRKAYSLKRDTSIKPRCSCGSFKQVSSSNRKILGYSDNQEFNVTGTWGELLRKRFIKDMNDGNVKICKRPETDTNGNRSVKFQAYKVYRTKFKLKGIAYVRNVLVFSDISNPDNIPMFASDTDRVPRNYQLGSDYHQGMLPHKHPIKTYLCTAFNSAPDDYGMLYLKNEYTEETSVFEWYTAARGDFGMDDYGNMFRIIK